MPSKPAPLRFDEYQGIRYFKGLNGVRCFAAVAVVWHHTQVSSPNSFFAHGHMGVDIFFVLSGFLITTLLLRERAAFGKISLVSFWARRALRLFPPYYALLAGMAAMYLILKPHDPDFVRFKENIHVYALYYSNWSHRDVNDLGHTWTLATEEQFYVLWPVLEAIGRPLVTGAVWLSAIILNQAMNFGLLDSSLRELGMMGAARSEIAQVTFTPILLGVALAHSLHRETSFGWLSRFVGWRGAAPVYLLAFLALLALGLPTFDGAPRLVMHLLITLFLASLVVRPSGTSARTLEWPLFEYLGTISYGIYLYHMVPTAFANQILANRIPWMVFPVTLVVTVSIAALSYQIFEKPLLRLGKRFRQVPIVRDPALDEADVAYQAPTPAP